MAFLNRQRGSLTAEGYFMAGLRIAVAMLLGGIAGGLVVGVLNWLMGMVAAGLGGPFATFMMAVSVVIGLAVHLIVNGYVAYKLFGYR